MLKLNNHFTPLDLQGCDIVLPHRPPTSHCDSLGALPPLPPALPATPTPLLVTPATSALQPHQRVVVTRWGSPTPSICNARHTDPSACDTSHICPPPPPTSHRDSLVGSPGLHLPSTTPNGSLGVLLASICPPSPPTSLTTTRWWFPGFHLPFNNVKL